MAKDDERADDDEIDQDAETRKPPAAAERARAADADAADEASDGQGESDDDESGDDESGDDESGDDGGDEAGDDEAETAKPPSVGDRAAARAAARGEVRRERPARVAGADADDTDADGGEGAEDEEDQAARVADALGVGEDGEAPSPAVEEAVAQNRAARRRDEARDRRRKRRDGARDAATESSSPDDLPRDRNARAKEVLLRRREQAAGGGRAVSSALLPSEMVDDALARSASAAGKWFRGNWNVIQWVIVGAVVVGGGFMFWTSRSEKSSGEASSFLGEALAAESGEVLVEDKRTDDQKLYDNTKIFKTADEREDAALSAYQKVVDTHGNSGAGILAKLGAAGVHLEKREWDPALSGFEGVLSTTLAGADPDVKGRALEGVGLAKEGKGDLDGALEAYKKVEGVDAKGYKELGMYHQARLLLVKGDKDKAKELLKGALDKLNAPGVDGKPFQQLQAMVETTLRDLDPTAVPAQKNNISGPKGTQMTPEELEKLIKKARSAAEKKAPEGGEPDGEH